MASLWASLNEVGDVWSALGTYFLEAIMRTLEKNLKGLNVECLDCAEKIFV